MALQQKNKVATSPKGYHSVTLYLIVKECKKAFDFYKQAFGAKEIDRHETGNGEISHAELKIGDSIIMLADEFPEIGVLAKPSPSMFIHLYVENVDAVVNKAIAAGAKLVKPVENMFYGDRCAMLEDASGHKWYIATHVEDVSKAEMKRRAADQFK